MAHVIHHGPYKSCEPTYLKLCAWIQEKGLRISGPMREVYPPDPRVVPPDSIITETLSRSVEVLFPDVSL